MQMRLPAASSFDPERVRVAAKEKESNLLTNITRRILPKLPEK